MIASGQTLAEAFGNACETLALHLESLQKPGKRMPEWKHRLVVDEVSGGPLPGRRSVFGNSTTNSVFQDLRPGNGYFFSALSSLAQVSRRDTVRLNTGALGCESRVSTQK